MSTTEEPATEQPTVIVESASTYGALIVESLHELEAAIETADDDRDPFAEWLENDALEVVVYVEANTSDPRHARAIVEVLVTFGGPTCWLARDVDLGEYVEVRTTWWSDRDTRRAWVPIIAQRLDDLADLYRQARA